MNRAFATMIMFSLFAIAAMMLPRIALAQSELIGTWKLNAEKSKFNPGPAPKNSVLTYEAAGEGVKVTNEGVNAPGNPTWIALRIDAFIRHLHALTRRFVGQDAVLRGWPGIELRFLGVELPCSDEFALCERDARKHHGRNGE